MIKANELRNIISTSDATIEKICDELSMKFKKLAEEGKREFFYYTRTSGFDHTKDEEARCMGYTHFETPPVWIRLVEQLKANGYAAKVEQYTPNRGGGLGSMRDLEDEPYDPYKYYRIKITW